MKSNKEIRVENLQILIEQAGGRRKFTDSQLARDLKIEYGFIGQLINSSRGIGDSVARKLEKIGEKPENWMDNLHIVDIGTSTSREEVLSVTPVMSGNTSVIDTIAKKVPLISWVSAGMWCEAIDNYNPGDAEDWLPCPVNCSHNTFALNVSGNSMTSMIPGSKTYPDRCVIYVDPGVQVTNGCNVIAKLKDQDEVTFKTYREDAGKKWLIPINPQYEKILIDENIIICGVVIGKFEPE